MKDIQKFKRNIFKLWISSTNILEYFLNKEIYNQSDFEKDTIIKKAKLYVETGNINLAEEILQKNNFCIISGAPGVGKTTLAQMLALKYISKKYTLVDISEDIKEAFKAYSPKKKHYILLRRFFRNYFFKRVLIKKRRFTSCKIY